MAGLVPKTPEDRLWPWRSSPSALAVVFQRLRPTASLSLQLPPPLIEFCQENALVINTLFQQHERRLYTWISPDGQYQNQIDYILCSQRWRSSIQSTKTRPGADCGSDHELLIAKFRLKLKKAGKTTRPFRYDLNQIPYDHTVEVRNRFKGLDLRNSLKNLGQRFMTLYRRELSRPSPRKRNAKRQNGCLRRPNKELRKEEKLKAKEKRENISI